MATKPRTITIDDTEYSTLSTYQDTHDSYWQFSRRDTDDMPLMETEAYYGETHRDGMDTMRLDDLIQQYGPIKDADPDLADKDEDIARALRSYRNSIRNMPSSPSTGRWSMTVGRLQQAVEYLAEELGLSADSPLPDED